MKKIFLCVLGITLFASAAFAGATHDFMNEVTNAMSSSTSREQVATQIGTLFTNERIKELINSGDDINSKNEYGITVLMMASAFSNTPEIIKTLLKAGADVNLRDENGANALMIAAVNTNYPEIITILTNTGIDVNTKAKDGQTALMLAVRFNKNPDVVRALINAGADVNATDSFFFGKNAKDWAKESGASQEIIKILEGS